MNAFKDILRAASYFRITGGTENKYMGNLSRSQWSLEDESFSIILDI